MASERMFFSLTINGIAICSIVFFHELKSGEIEY